MNHDKITVMLVDDHALFRAGLVVLLSKVPDVGTVLEAESGKTLRDYLSQGQEVDLMLLDYELPDTNGLDILAEVKQEQPELPIILLSANVDTALIQAALAQHASGFITKTSSPDVMLSAIQLVMSGGIYIPPEAIAEVNGGAASPSGSASFGAVNKALDQVQLTQRQMDVLLQMKHGYSNKEIARELNMSPSTVKVHVAAILRALDVNSRTQAVFVAKDSGLLG